MQKVGDLLRTCSAVLPLNSSLRAHLRHSQSDGTGGGDDVCVGEQDSEREAKCFLWVWFLAIVVELKGQLSDNATCFVDGHSAEISVKSVAVFILQAYRIESTAVCGIQHYRLAPYLDKCIA